MARNLERRIERLERTKLGRCIVVMYGDGPVVIDGISPDEWEREHPLE